MSSTSTRTDRTDPWTSTRPQPTPHHVPGRPSACSDGTDSAALSTNTCRSHEVTGFSAPTGLLVIGTGSDTLRQTHPTTSPPQVHLTAAGPRRHAADCSPCPKLAAARHGV